jgi:hypothetical protein
MLPTGRARAVALTGVVAAGTLMLQCTGASSPEAPSQSPAFTPVLSVRELMEHIVDPSADRIFDSAVIEVSEKGIVETKPVTDEDWLKVERGAMELAEASNLLKIPRQVAFPGDDETFKPADGSPSPELPPAEIQAKIDADRATWNKHADGLRAIAIESMKVARARDTDALFRIGGDIDQACESCHLEYWYPGDKKAVLEDQQKRATYGKPQN